MNPASPGPSSDRGPRGGGRVLVVEGDDAAASRLAELLDGAGFTPLTVPARAAVAAVQLFEPDVVLLGPGADEVAGRLSALPADLRPHVLVLDLRNPAEGSGASDDVLDRVRRACSGG